MIDSTHLSAEVFDACLPDAIPGSGNDVPQELQDPTIT